jgi:hypothetical protein
MLPVPFDDLESALYWVSGSVAFDNAAYISKATGQIFYASMSHEVEDELPEDVDDAGLYWSVPHKNDLDLGRKLVYRFVEEHLPGQFRFVQEIFHHRGAYARFKDLLQRAGQIEAWHAYESAATRAALLAWAEEQGMPVAAG